MTRLLGTVGLLALLATFIAAVWWFGFRGEGVRVAIDDGGIDDACPGRSLPDPRFVDVPARSPVRREIACVVWWDVASGVSTDRFAPDEPLTRGQLAVLLTRARDLAGADPVELDAPTEAVTRGQLASLVVATYDDAVGEPLPPGDDAFADDDGSVHEDAIDAAAADGLVGGTSETTYSPTAPVTRAQAAVVLARLLDRLVQADVAEPPTV